MKGSRLLTPYSHVNQSICLLCSGPMGAGRGGEGYGGGWPSAVSRDCASLVSVGEDPDSVLHHCCVTVALRFSSGKQQKST